MASYDEIVVNLSDENLIEIPEEVLLKCGEIHILDISRNPGLVLHNCLGRFVNVRTLLLAQCALRTIPDEICELQQLEKLDLSCNDLSVVLNPVIGRLFRLRKLDMKGCSLQIVPEWLGDLQQLIELDLSYNDLFEGLSPVIGRLSCLRKLYLKKCSLRSLPDFFGVLEKLWELDLSFNDFSKGLSPVVGRLRCLIKLDLRGCSLRSVPDSLGDFQQLGELDLSINDFSEGLSPVIRRLRYLQKLYLKGCRLRSVPDWFEDWAQLQELDLSCNDFSEGLSAVIWRLRCLRKLDLKGCSLRRVADSLGDLEQLEELEVSHNNFADGLQPLVQLKQLRKLNIIGCHLFAVPYWLTQLPKLQALDLSHNTFSDCENPKFEQLQHLEKLNLSNCALRVNPQWFEHLYQLEELDLRDNELLDSMSGTIGRLPRLKLFNGSRFHITELPIRLKDQIHEINLSYHVFADGFNPMLRRLKCLKILELTNCALTCLPNWLGEFTLLQELDLSKNNFSAGINSAIGQLHRLQKLNLIQCRLSTLPLSIGDLEQLEELNLSNNNFTTGINEAIGRLRQLKTLYFRQCGLLKVPDWIENLDQLQEFDLSQNNFDDGINPAIGQLHRLKKLDLSHCSISTLPASFAYLEQLIDLRLKDNKLEVYPQCILRLFNLRRLDISLERSDREEHHGITKLPVDLADSRLSELFFDGNRITEPPREIWRQGLEAIKSYFKEQRHGLIEVLPDTVNMIGNVCAGKTSIAKSLQILSPQLAKAEMRTRVMDQLPVSFGRNREWLININDFGGHAIYHSVILIFLPTNGLVILAYDMSKEFDEQSRDVRRWLLTVIAKSTEIRVIVVGTHADKVGGMRQQLEKQMKNHTLKVLNDVKLEVVHHMDNLKKALTTDAELQWISMVEQKLQHLEELRKRLNEALVRVVSLSCCIQDDALTKLHQLVSFILRAPIKMPRRWSAVMDDIKNATSECHYLKWKQVQDIYKKHVTDVEGDEDLLVILRYLASTSQVIWLEKHNTLGHIVFNSPQKIIKVCKNVLHHDRARFDYESEQQQPDNWSTVYRNDVEHYAQGIVHQPFIKVLLRSTDDEQVNTAVEFLKQFNLISEIKPDLCDRIFAIPSNLPKLKPTEKMDAFDKHLIACDESIVMELSFVGSLIPMSFFETSVSSMLTTAHELAKPELSTLAWQDGLFILYKGVCFTARRNYNTVIFTSFADNNSDEGPWTILRPVFERLYIYITGTWHGALPGCHILCPSCQRKRKQITSSSTAKIGKFEISFEVLAGVSLPERYRPMCKECLETVP